MPPPTHRLLNIGCGRHAHPDWVNLDCVALVPGVQVHDVRNGLPFEDGAFEAVYHSHLLEHLRHADAPKLLRECHRVLASGGVLRLAVPDLETICRLYLQNLDAAVAGDTEAARRYDWIVLELLDQIARDHGGGEMGAYWRRNPMPAESFVVQRMGSEVLRFREWWLQQPEALSAASRPEAHPESSAEELGRFRQSGEIHQWMYDRWSLGQMLRDCGFVAPCVCRADESAIPDFRRYQLDEEPGGSIRKPDSLFMEARKPPLRSVILNTYDIQGGAARAAWRLHRGLRHLGHESTLLVLHKTGTDENVQALTVDASPEATVRCEHWNDLAERYVNQNRTAVSQTWFSLPIPGYDLTRHPAVLAADVVNLHWVSGLISPASIQALQALGKPVVWTLHDQRAFTGGCHYSAGCRGFEQECAGCPQLGGKSPGLAAAVLRSAREIIDADRLTIVCPSRWMAECARRSALFGRCRIEVIPYGLQTDVFSPRPKAEARLALGLDPHGVYFLFGADSVLDQRKGIHVLREAIQIAQQTPSFAGRLTTGDLRWLNFGRRSEQEPASPLPGHSFGHVKSDEQMALIYAAADVLICPTLEDNLPNTILESLACGTAVLGSRVGGVPELITNGQNGLLFAAGDAVGLAGLLRWAALNPLPLADWGRLGRERIEREHPLDRQARAYAKLFAELAPSPVAGVPPQNTAAPAPLLPQDWELPAPATY